MQIIHLVANSINKLSPFLDTVSSNPIGNLIKLEGWENLIIMLINKETVNYN